MSRSRAVAALVAGLGLVAGVIVATVVAAVVLVALGLPASGRADDGSGVAILPAAARPTQLVVGLRLSDPRLQAGVVREDEVVLARGLEVDVARALAGRLHTRGVRFVDLDSPYRVAAVRSAAWHVATTTVRPTRRLSVTEATLSAVYLPLGQAVVQRRGQHPLRSLAELRSLRLCATRGSDGARALSALSGVRNRPVLVPSDDRLFRVVQTGLCDAALVGVIDVRGFVAGRRGLVGAVAARLDVGQGLAVAVAGDSGLRASEVDRVLRRMRADGTISRLARMWLGIDPLALRALR